MSTLTTRESVWDVLSREATGVFQVKPRVLFRSVEDCIGRPIDMNLQLPSSEIGSITLLEGAQMVSAVKLIRPRCIFEFGTFLGYSTSLLARNAAEGTKVWSIDIGDGEFESDIGSHYSLNQIMTDATTNDSYLRRLQHEQGTVYLAALSETLRSQVRLIRQDSQKLDVDSLGLVGEVDFVFIDGGHDMTTIESDTRNAFRMIGPSGVVVWHDYASTVHSAVTEFVDQFASRRSVLHVESTMLAVCPVGEAARRMYGWDQP